MALNDTSILRTVKIFAPNIHICSRFVRVIHLLHNTAQGIQWL